MRRLALSAALLAACSAAPGSVAPEPAARTDAIGAYMIVQGKGYDPAALGPYAASLPPIYAKYGGRYVAFETKPDIAEGSNDAQAIILSAWPSAEAARAFWDSPEYREAIKLREGIGTFDVAIVRALPPY